VGGVLGGIVFVGDQLKAGRNDQTNNESKQPCMREEDWSIETIYLTAIVV
jgi:hypothetical protein